MNETVRTARRGPVVEITLDRPKANAIDHDTSRRLGAAFEAFRDDDELQVAIVTGAGDRFFSAGWDLKAAAAGEESAEEDYGPGGFAGLTELFDLDKPVIAALNGLAVGGGFELALAADLVVAATDVEVFLPEAGLGIAPNAGGMLRLPRRIPRAVALEMLYTGRRMGAEEALRLGLFNAVVPREALVERARDLAADVVRSAPLSLRAIKQVTRETAHLAVRDAYVSMRELPAYRRMVDSEDAREGPRAFAEKRAPVWKGR